MWISQENENCQGQTNRQPSPSPRPQKAHNCVKFSKSSRLLAKEHYSRVIKGGSKWNGQLVLIDYRLGKSTQPKLGLTVSRKYGKAHLRNRFKRVAREAFRTLHTQLPSDLEMNVVPRYAYIHPMKEDLLSEFTRFLDRIKRAS